MTEFEKLKALVGNFEFVGPGVQVHVMETAPTGDFRVGFIGAGFNKFQAVLVPVEQNCPVRIVEPIWTDLETCLGAARKLAALASG